MQKLGGIRDAEHHNSDEVLKESSYLLSTRQTWTIRTIITDLIRVDCVGLLLFSRALLNPKCKDHFLITLLKMNHCKSQTYVTAAELVQVGQQPQIIMKSRCERQSKKCNQNEK